MANSRQAIAPHPRTGHIVVAACSTAWPGDPERIEFQTIFASRRARRANGARWIEVDDRQIAPEAAAN